MKRMCKELLDVLQQIAELNKLFNTINGIVDDNTIS